MFFSYSLYGTYTASRLKLVRAEVQALQCCVVHESPEEERCTVLPNVVIIEDQFLQAAVLAQGVGNQHDASIAQLVAAQV